MKWVTRKQIRVNRVATAWLIRRFIDPQAEFIFVEPDEVGYTDRTDTDTTRAVEAVTTTWQEIVEDDDDLDEDSIH